VHGCHVNVVISSRSDGIYLHIIPTPANHHARFLQVRDLQLTNPTAQFVLWDMKPMTATANTYNGEISVSTLHGTGPAGTSFEYQIWVNNAGPSTTLATAELACPSVNPAGTTQRTPPLPPTWLTTITGPDYAPSPSTWTFKVNQQVGACHEESHGKMDRQLLCPSFYESFGDWKHCGHRNEF
jgi:hypothetical protein